MERHITDEIAKMSKIQLKQQDFIGKGAFANVYRYKIHNTELTVKCFKDQRKANEVNAVLYTILKLNITRLNTQQHSKELENIGNQLVKEYPEFQQNNEILLKMVNLEGDDRPKIIQVCQALINQKQFQMDALQNCNLQAAIIQLINSYSQPKSNINSPINLPYFNSDILKTSLYSNMILALFEKQDISLSRIHQQLNIKDNFNHNQFHKDCDNKGSTLVIMHCNEEPNSFFGGMAVPSWNSEERDIVDPIGECSWLFKIEVGENMLYLHQWKCIKKDEAIFGGQNCGPYFGDMDGCLAPRWSKLASNNKFYKNVNLAEQLNNMTRGLLYQLRTQIACPQKVSREIMNEEYKQFFLDSCEVFLIKK